MKLVVSFYGMCLCVLDGRKGNRVQSASVLLLNGAAPPSTNTLRVLSRPQLPYHHPLLFAPARQADVKKSAPPVPALETLVDTEGLMSGRQLGWSLAGLDITLGRGKGISLYENQVADATGRLPDPSSAKDYLDWRRLPDLSRIAPGARLRPTFTKIGAQVLGIVRFTGGELRGATPKNVAGNAAPWRFSATFDQVITDRFEFHCDLPGSELVARGPAGGRPQVIKLAATGGKTVRLAVVHEASAASTAMYTTAGLAARSESLPHYMAFYDAIQGNAVAGLQPPRPGGSGGPAIDNPNCPRAVFPRP